VKAGGAFRFGVGIWNAVDGRATQLYVPPDDNTNVKAIAFVPEGNGHLIAAMTIGAANDLYEIDLRTRQLTPLTNTGGVDPIWWTPALSKTGVEEVPYVEERNETDPTRPHA
jgi:hypothetical protein